VVLADIDMPRLDGHEVIAARRVTNRDVPIIAISGGRGLDKDELLLKAAKLGAVEVIVKPFEFRQLLEARSRDRWGSGGEAAAWAARAASRRRRRQTGELVVGPALGGAAGFHDMASCPPN
jgi:CheY-like chemotaxis protein